jgi:energy-coupling factor transporter ATP-binding protein EcfA2
MEWSPAAIGSDGRANRWRKNPFATSRIRPGRLAPRDAHGHPLDLRPLVARLRGAAGTVALVGPHGSGKSNLLSALVEALASEGREVTILRVVDRPDASAVLAAVGRAAPGQLVAVDGWERVGRCTGWVLRVLARRRGCGLLVTAHRPGTLSVLLACHTTPALLARLVDDLPDHDGFVRPPDIDAAFRATSGNLREALLVLYDCYERRSRIAADREVRWERS